MLNLLRKVQLEHLSKKVSL